MTGSFDLEGLVKWGVSKALDHGQTQTGLPLGELASHASKLVEGLGIPSIEFDPLMMTMGRIVLAGIDRQRKIQEALQAQEVKPDVSG